MKPIYRFDFLVLHDGKVINEGRAVIEEENFDNAVKNVSREIVASMPHDGKKVLLRLTLDAIILDVTPSIVVPGRTN